jgi:hypothetical protein
MIALSSITLDFCSRGSSFGEIGRDGRIIEEIGPVEETVLEEGTVRGTRNKALAIEPSAERYPVVGAAIYLSTRGLSRKRKRTTLR